MSYITAGYLQAHVFDPPALPVTNMRVWFEFPEQTRFARTGRADILYTPIFFANEGINAHLCLSEAWTKAYDDFSQLDASVKLIGKASLGFLSIAGRPVSALDTRYAMPSVGFRPIYTLTIMEMDRRLRLDEHEDNRTPLSFSIPTSTLDQLQQLASSLKIITADTHSSMDLFREASPALIVSVQYSLVALIKHEGKKITDTEQEIRIFVSLSPHQVPTITPEMVSSNPLCQQVMTQIVPLGKSKSKPAGTRRRDSLPLLRRLSRTTSTSASAQDDSYLIVEVEKPTPFNFRIKDDAAASKVTLSITYYGNSADDEDDDQPPPPITASITSLLRTHTSLTLEPLLPEDRTPDDQGNVQDDFFHLRAKILPLRKFKLNFVTWEKVVMTPTAIVQAQTHIAAEAERLQTSTQTSSTRHRSSTATPDGSSGTTALYQQQEIPPSLHFRRTSQSLAPPTTANDSDTITDATEASRTDGNNTDSNIAAVARSVDGSQTASSISEFAEVAPSRSSADNIQSQNEASRLSAVSTNEPVPQESAVERVTSTSSNPAPRSTTTTDVSLTTSSSHASATTPRTPTGTAAPMNSGQSSRNRPSATRNPATMSSITTVTTNATTATAATIGTTPTSRSTTEPPKRWRTKADLWLTHPITSTLTPSFTTPYLSHLYSLKLEITLSDASSSSLSSSSSPASATATTTPSSATRRKSIGLKSSSIFKFSSSSSSSKSNTVELITPVQVRYDLGLVPSYEIDSDLPEYDHSLPVYEDAVGLNPGTAIVESAEENHPPPSFSASNASATANASAQAEQNTTVAAAATAAVPGREGGARRTEHAWNTGNAAAEEAAEHDADDDVLDMLMRRRVNTRTSRPEAGSRRVYADDDVGGISATTFTALGTTTTNTTTTTASGTGTGLNTSREGNRTGGEEGETN